MAETFELEVVTPERQLVKEQVEEAQIPAKNGYLGVLPGHAPLLSELGTGFLYYVSGRQEDAIFGARRIRSKCCRTACRCWQTRASAPKRSTWSARGGRWSGRSRRW